MSDKTNPTKDERLTFRLPKKEAAALRRLAESHGGVSELLRKMVGMLLVRGGRLS